MIGLRFLSCQQQLSCFRYIFRRFIYGTTLFDEFYEEYIRGWHKYTLDPRQGSPRSVLQEPLRLIDDKVALVGLVRPLLRPPVEPSFARQIQDDPIRVAAKGAVPLRRKRSPRRPAVSTQGLVKLVIVGKTTRHKAKSAGEKNRPDKSDVTVPMPDAAPDRSQKQCVAHENDQCLHDHGEDQRLDDSLEGRRLRMGR